MLAIVIGGAGGIGAGLVRQLLRTDDITHVVATWHNTPPAAGLANSDNISASHNSDRLSWLQLDVTSETSHTAFSRELLTIIEHLKSRQADPSRATGSGLGIGWVINTVGVLHSEQMQPEKSLSAFKATSLAAAIETNCLPTLLLAQTLGPQLKSTQPAVFASVSARVGSISDNRLGGWYSYRISKAALNMALRTLAVEWGRSHPNVCVAALHPGTTATALSEPFQKNVPAEKLFDADATAGYLLQVMASLDASKSGRFWAWDGTEIPW